MSDILKGVDPWFLNLLVFFLVMYFMWSIKGLFMDLKDSIGELKKLIADLYDDRNNHGERITALETRCNERHAVRSGVDRRDPA